jgi:hypothetical protein
MSIATSNEPFVLPPCYDSKIFDNVASVILNDPMADSLASAIRRSEIKHPLLDEIVKDLIGTVSNEFYSDLDDTVPSYTYSYFRNCGTLKLNPAAAELLSQAIFLSGAGRPVSSHLWSLHFHLKKVNEPSKASVDCRHFYGINSILMTDTVTDTLASALQRSEIKHPVLTAIVNEIIGLNEETEAEEEMDDRNDNVAAFDFVHFRKCCTLTLNKVASALVSQAILFSGGGRAVPEHLLVIQRFLREGHHRKEKEDHAA